MKQDGHASQLKETGLFLLDILYNAVIIIVLVVVIRSVLISPYRVVGSSMADTLHDKEFILIDKISYILGDIDRGDPIVFLPPVSSRDNPKFENMIETDAQGQARVEIGSLEAQKHNPYCQNRLLTVFWFCTAKASVDDSIYFAPQERQIGSGAYQTQWEDVEKIYLDETNIKDGYVEIEGEPNAKYSFRIYDSKGPESYVKRVIGLPGDTVKIENGLVYLKKPGETDFTEIDEPYLNHDNAGKTYPNILRESGVYEVPEGHYFVMGDNRNHSSDSRGWLEPVTQAESPFVPEANISGRVFVVLWPFTEIRSIH